MPQAYHELCLAWLCHKMQCVWTGKWCWHSLPALLGEPVAGGRTSRWICSDMPLYVLYVSMTILDHMILQNDNPQFSSSYKMVWTNLEREIHGIIKLEGLTGSFLLRKRCDSWRRASHTPTSEFFVAGHGGGLDRFSSASSDPSVLGLQQLENHL